MTVFMFRDHRGMGAPFAAALTTAGFPLADEGDLLLIDHEAPGSPYGEWFRKCQRAFLYPHGGGPILFTMYPHRPEVRGHFVIGTGQADLLAWTDERPTTVVGWPHGPLLPWRATEGRRVLFAPTHPDGFGWLADEHLDAEERTFGMLLRLGLQVRTRRLGSPTPIADDVDWADVVVTAPGSFPSFAVSRGCPTVVYGEHLTPREEHPTTRDVLTYPEWAELLPLFKFPTFDGDLADQITAACTADLAADWRGRFVGEAFDPARFVEAFNRAVDEW